MILLECPHSGERCLVESAEGYEGWAVLSQDAPLPPSYHCSWCCDTECWIEDEESKAKHAALCCMRDPEELWAIIQDLTARIAVLESKQGE